MMTTSNNSIMLSEDDLREIFSLFTSSTKYERDQVYDDQSGHYFLKEGLFEEHTLTEEKREFALDAWRAVIYFLHSRGYSLYKDGKRTDLSFSEDEFIA
jgi:hypothetical protein